MFYTMIDYTEGTIRNDIPNLPSRGTNSEALDELFEAESSKNIHYSIIANILRLCYHPLHICNVGLAQ